MLQETYFVAVMGGFMTDSEILNEVINYLQSEIGRFEYRIYHLHEMPPYNENPSGAAYDSHRSWCITNQMAYQRLLWQIEEMREKHD